MPADRPTPAEARILVAITVHFDVARLGYLAEVLRALAEFPVAALHAILATNTADSAELTILQRLCDEILVGKTAEIRTYEHLAHPFHLTWQHKDYIESSFNGTALGRYTHFIYLEDDIRFSYSNFCYFLEYREVLREVGLLPSFVRVEYNRELHGYVSSDNVAPIDLNEQPHIEHGDTIITNVPLPYNACYVLDAELAAEFRGTRSFRRERSRAVSDMGVRERAAMGLCYENVPQPFHCRYVLPISRKSGMVLSCAWVSHLPNNYANDPNTNYGTVRMGALFAPGIGAIAVTPEGARIISRSRWTNMDFYMVIPGRLIESLRWRLGISK